jgi:hypothetical protein
VVGTEQFTAVRTFGQVGLTGHGIADAARVSMLFTDRVTTRVAFDTVPFAVHVATDGAGVLIVDTEGLVTRRAVDEITETRGLATDITRIGVLRCEVVLTGVTLHCVIGTPQFVVRSHFDVMCRARCPTTVSTRGGMRGTDACTGGVFAGLQADLTVRPMVGTDR